MTFINAQTATVFGTETTKGINIWARLWKMAALRKQRLELSRLTADQLADIGVSAMDAQTEAQRPVWDAPKNWKN